MKKDVISEVYKEKEERKHKARLRSELKPLLNALIDELSEKQNIIDGCCDENGRTTDMNTGIWNGLEEAKDLIKRKRI